MSLHPERTPTRDEVIRAYTKPIPASVTTTLLALAAIGTLAFIAGLFIDPDRAWRAYHVSWLYVTSLSSAGVVFVAVQRITTARWSRPIIRFMEGYVAFLPVAFVMLLLSVFLGKSHIFPWTHELPPVPEKVTYFNPTFLSARRPAAHLAPASGTRPTSSRTDVHTYQSCSVVSAVKTRIVRAAKNRWPR